MKHVVHRIHDNTKQGLIDLLEHIPSGISMIEIGSWAGESAKIWAESKKFNNIYCIDPWDTGECNGRDITEIRKLAEVEKTFDIITKPYDNIIKHKGFSYNIISLIPKVGFIYIDRDHKYNAVKNDILLAKTHLTEPFILGGHDYNDPRTPGVTQAVNEIIGTPDFTFVDHSWLKIIKE